MKQASEDIYAREAFVDTLQAVEPVLRAFKPLPPQQPEGRVRVPLDLATLSERVLAGLCTHWIGLPEDAPRPWPAALVSGPAQDQAVLAALSAWLASGRVLGPLALKLRDGLQHVAEAERDAVVARCIAGELLGLATTVHGTFLRTMETWIDDKLLWACQQRLAEVPADVTDPFARAEQALLEPLLLTMRERQMPDMPWRCSALNGEAPHAADAAHELMFGGARHGELKTVNGCPGYGIGLGVLLGLLAGVLEAGTLRPTGSPVLLMLTPN